MSKLLNKIFAQTIVFIFLAEILSFLGYIQPVFNKIGFIAIALITIILSFKKLEYGFWVLLVELFIGSKGYLFFFEYGNIKISIRIALWLIIVAIWAGKTIITKKEKISQIFNICHYKYSAYFITLFLFIAWGLINSLLNKNSASETFFDFNAWLYFILIFPAYDTFYRDAEKIKEKIQAIFEIFSASFFWICIKTLFLLFIFSHNLWIITFYRWLGVTGVGEITRMENDFYRIFFQSHIYILAGFFIFLFLLNNFLSKAEIKNKIKEIVFCFSFIVLSISVILLSFSRSNWVGLAAGFILFSLIILVRYDWRRVLLMPGILFISTLLSLLLIFCIAKFPYPNPVGQFLTADMLSERASQITGEAGASSRWALLPNLWQQISEAPVMGKGFGSTVTYITSDPRILEKNPSGNYTTYAFEWGWLDIWLKLGLLGLVAYLAFIAVILYNNVKNIDIFSEVGLIKIGLTVGLLTMVAVSFFSPYMNHPLGIGYLILVSLVTDRQLDKNKKVRSCAL